MFSKNVMFILHEKSTYCTFLDNLIDMMYTDGPPDPKLQFLHLSYTSNVNFREFLIHIKLTLSLRIPLFIADLL